MNADLAMLEEQMNAEGGSDEDEDDEDDGKSIVNRCGIPEKLTSNQDQ